MPVRRHAIPYPGHRYESPEFDTLCRYFSGALPQSYLVLDLSANSLQEDAQILAIRYLQVMEGHAYAPVRHYLRWSHLFPSGGDSPLEVLGEQAQRYGGDPVEVLESFQRLLQQRPKGTILVGHNLTGFGLPLLARHLQSLTNFDVYSVPFVDVGMLQKSIHAGILPGRGERATTFQHRVSSWSASGVKWSLEHCRAEYGISLPPGPFSRLHAINSIYQKQHALLRRRWLEMTADDTDSYTRR